MGARIEGVQDHVAAGGIVEAIQVAAVGVGDHRAVATRECPCEQFADRGALAGAGGADHLEVLGFVERRDGDAGEREGGGLSLAAAALLQAGAVFDAGAALVAAVAAIAGSGDTGQVAEQHQRREPRHFKRVAGDEGRSPAGERVAQHRDEDHGEGGDRECEYREQGEFVARCLGADEAHQHRDRDQGVDQHPRLVAVGSAEPAQGVGGGVQGCGSIALEADASA